MRKSKSIDLHWPPACVGCAATTQLQSEKIRGKFGEAKICINCIEIARIEQLLIRGWKLAIALVSYLLISIGFLFIGNSVVGLFFSGLVMLLPILLLEGVFSTLNYSESYLEIKNEYHIVFRDSLFSNIFASSNPEVDAELDLSFHSTENRRNRIFPFCILYFPLLIMATYLSIEQYFPGFFDLGLTINEILPIIVSVFLVNLVHSSLGIFTFYILLNFWERKMTLILPVDQALVELTNHTPTLRTGPISTKGDPTFGQNVEVDFGQRTLMEKAEDAIQSGDFTDAARLCRKAIDIDPMDIEAWKSLAIAHAKSRKCIESRDALQRARDLTKDPTAIESTLEECKEYCGDIFDLPPSETISLSPVISSSSDETEEFRRQIDENPMSPQIWAKMATVLAKSGRCVDARDALQRAKDIDPNESMIENAMKTCKECCIEEFSSFEL